MVALVESTSHLLVLTTSVVDSEKKVVAVTSETAPSINSELVVFVNSVVDPVIDSITELVELAVADSSVESRVLVVTGSVKNSVLEAIFDSEVMEASGSVVLMLASAVLISDVADSGAPLKVAPALDSVVPTLVLISIGSLSELAVSDTDVLESGITDVSLAEEVVVSEILAVFSPVQAFSISLLELPDVVVEGGISIELVMLSMVASDRCCISSNARVQGGRRN